MNVRSLYSSIPNSEGIAATTEKVITNYHNISSAYPYVK